jgi:hypothetical protein
LWPTVGIRLGYLDLVLNVRDAQQCNSAIWVEVKVDAGPSGDQLKIYKEHAALLKPPPAIITLARQTPSAHPRPLTLARPLGAAPRWAASSISADVATGHGLGGKVTCNLSLFASRVRSMRNIESRS